MSLSQYAFEVRQLYRHCLRTAFRIPDAGARIYYRNHVNCIVYFRVCMCMFSLTIQIGSNL